MTDPPKNMGGKKQAFLTEDPMTRKSEAQKRLEKAFISSRKGSPCSRIEPGIEKTKELKKTQTTEEELRKKK